VYIENPNYFGCIEESLVDLKGDLKDALLIVGVNPVSLGVLGRRATSVPTSWWPTASRSGTP